MRADEPGYYWICCTASTAHMGDAEITDGRPTPAPPNLAPQIAHWDGVDTWHGFSGWMRCHFGNADPAIEVLSGPIVPPTA